MGELELYRRILAEFTVIGPAALARFRDRDPCGYRRFSAYADRLSARDQKRLAAAFEDAMRTMQ